LLPCLAHGRDFSMRGWVIIRNRRIPAFCNTLIIQNQYSTYWDFALCFCALRKPDCMAAMVGVMIM
jgi:hypothetical protein